jgi:hypothetical protein
MSKSNRILQIILFYRFALFSQPQSGHIGRLSTNQSKTPSRLFSRFNQRPRRATLLKFDEALLLDLRPVKDPFKLIFRFNQRHMQALARPSPPRGTPHLPPWLIVDVTVLWVFPSSFAKRCGYRRNTIATNYKKYKEKLRKCKNYHVLAQFVSTTCRQRSSQRVTKMTSPEAI